MDASAHLKLVQWMASLTGLGFIFALGAIVGSFTNVLVYRLPKGENIVHPPSACPRCGTKLRWTENFPIFGWLWLRGKCRFCKSPISCEYPLIELLMALLFGSLYVLWFMSPALLKQVGLDVEGLRPDWSNEGIRWMWPALLIHFSLIASLIAMTLIDARTFMIPLILPWTATVVGVIGHTAHAVWFGATRGSLMGDPAWPWTIPTFGWQITLAALLGTGGLALAIGLLKLGVIPRSFDHEYESWATETEAKAAAAEKDKPAAETSTPENAPVRIGPLLHRVLLLTGPAMALMSLGFVAGLKVNAPIKFMTIGMALGLIIGLALRRLAPDDADADDANPYWVSYPHIRREMWRETLFLAPAAMGLGLGWWLGAGASGEPSLWMSALGGSLAGLLAGGGVVWIVRILGSLAFGKEAMGAGDAHLLAAVGACLGLFDPLIAFFIAPFFGIAWAILSLMSASVFKREGHALPYGPHLALATILLIYFKPGVERVISAIARAPIDLP